MSHGRRSGKWSASPAVLTVLLGITVLLVIAAMLVATPLGETPATADPIPPRLDVRAPALPIDARATVNVTCTGGTVEALDDDAGGTDLATFYVPGAIASTTCTATLAAPVLGFRLTATTCSGVAMSAPAVSCQLTFVEDSVNVSVAVTEQGLSPDPVTVRRGNGPAFGTLLYRTTITISPDNDPFAEIARAPRLRVTLPSTVALESFQERSAGGTALSGPMVEGCQYLDGASGAVAGVIDCEFDDLAEGGTASSRFFDAKVRVLPSTVTTTTSGFAATSACPADLCVTSALTWGTSGSATASQGTNAINATMTVALSPFDQVSPAATFPDSQLIIDAGTAEFALDITNTGDAPLTVSSLNGNVGDVDVTCSGAASFVVAVGATVTRRCFGLATSDGRTAVAVTAFEPGAAGSFAVTDWSNVMHINTSGADLVFASRSTASVP